MIFREIVLIPPKKVDRNVNESLKFNQETEFIPILGLIEDQLNEKPSDSDDEKDEKVPKGSKVASSIQDNHHPALLSLVAGELSVAPEEIHDFELYVESSLFGAKLTR